MRHNFIGLGCVLIGMMTAQGVSHAQISAPSIVTMAALDVTAITATPALAITPVTADYSGSSPSVTAALPIVLTVTTTRATGCRVSVSGTPGGANGIANTDLYLKSSSAGSQTTTYTSVSNLSGATFWNANTPQVATIVNVDVNVRNLVSYPGPAIYTNTLTWTVTPN